MTQARQVIRDYVESQISGFGVPVYKGKAWLEDVSDLPAINIMTPGDARAESFARTTLPAPSVYLEVYALAVEIEIRAVASTDILDVLDDLAGEIQAALSQDVTWGGLVKMMRLSGTETEISTDLQLPAGILTMAYAADYQINMRDPSAPQ